MIELTLQVNSQLEADELRMAWQEIITRKKLVRTEALERDTESIMERAREALQRIETAIRTNDSQTQAQILVQFVASLYNGYAYGFDLIRLRSLDQQLAGACLDYLNYDRFGTQEIHRHLSGGDRELWRWIKDYGVELKNPKTDAEE